MTRSLVICARRCVRWERTPRLETGPIRRLYRSLNRHDRMVLLPLEERLPVSFRSLRRGLLRPGRWLLHWANNAVAAEIHRSADRRTSPEAMALRHDE